MSKIMTNLPKEQRCQFLIGPMSTWFKPNTTDIWTQMKTEDEKEKASLSYFIYGSIGCFCFGEIYHNDRLSAAVKHLVDVKEDNSRIICVRFLKQSLYPLVMILSESGSLIIHDCLSNEYLIHFKKNELINRLVPREETNSEHCNKKPKFNVTQQIKSCVWPNSNNAFLAITLPKRQTNLLFWLKLRDLTDGKHSQEPNLPPISKSNIIESQERLNLDLPETFRQICCMESAMLNSQTCLVVAAFDRGLIIVVKVNFEQGQSSRIIKLACHDADVCSMALFVENTKRFPQGLLASVSRNGELLVWDIENEFYFADYCLKTKFDESSVDWFSLSFIVHKNSKNINVVVSNIRNGLTTLRIPDNVRSKTRLREIKETKPKKGTATEYSISHQKLIFNLAYDPISAILLTSSHDANHILWKCNECELPDKSATKEGTFAEVKPQYMLPSMADNSRTHMLRHSQIRESLLGAALGKGGIVFYDIAKNTQNHRFDMSSSRLFIVRKILKESLCPTSLSWHPSHEYRLAIGTLEGKVLRADLTPKKATLVMTGPAQKPKSRAGDTHKTEDLFDVDYQPIDHQEDDQPSKTDGVYSLCWGPNPCCPQDISRTSIYAIGSISHRLFIYHTMKETSDCLTNYLDEFLDQSLPEAMGEASEVSWKPSMDLMALGTTTGKIIIVSYLDEAHSDRSKNQLFKKLAVIQEPLSGTYIQCLAWHPTTDIEDTYFYQIAASGNESPAYVFDLRENLLVADVKARLRIRDGNGFVECLDATTNVVSTYVFKLDSHKKAISDIVWNPHEPNQLATCSFDRECLVWSLDESAQEKTAKVISRFLGRNRLFTLEWSLVDTDLIYTSGHDSTIWAWRPSENCAKIDYQSM